MGVSGGTTSVMLTLDQMVSLGRRTEAFGLAPTESVVGFDVWEYSRPDRAALGTDMSGIFKPGDQNVVQNPV